MTAIQEKVFEMSPMDRTRELTAVPAEESENKEIKEYRLGSIEQIPPGEGRQFRVAERDIAVFRARNGALYATQAACPHRGGPLIDRLLGGSTLVCPLHAWKWDMTTGKPLFGECTLTTYIVHLTVEGEMMLRLEV